MRVDATDDTGVATVVHSVAIDRIVPRAMATNPWLTVKKNARLDIPSFVRDRSDNGWVTTGRVDAISFRSPTPGIHYLTVTVRDHAGDHEKVLEVIEVRVK